MEHVWVVTIFGWAAVLSVVNVMAAVITIVVPLVALTVWLRGTNPLVRLALHKDRRRTVGQTLEGTLSRREVRRHCKEHAQGVISGRIPLTPARELQWLDELTGLAEPTRPRPLRPLSRGGTDQPQEVLGSLSEAYRTYAGRLRSRGLLGAGSAPVIEQQAEVAEQVARLLEVDSVFAMTPVPASTPVEVRLPARRTTISLTCTSLEVPGGFPISGISVRHTRSRVVASRLARQLADHDGVVAHDVGETIADLGYEFDGVLPALRGAYLERHGASGQNRINLDLTEMSYSAFRVLRDAGAATEHDPILTLSCLVITSDNYLVMVTRSQAVAYSGDRAPGVVGNLDMRPRLGEAIDVDEFGLPDPIRAVSREAQEELALSLDPHEILPLGIAEISCEHEAGTRILLTTARARCTTTELARQAAAADPVEGAWELNDEILFVPVPTTTSAAEYLLAWTMASEDHMPHLTASLVAWSLALLSEHQDGESASVDSGAERVHRRLASLQGRAATADPPGSLRIDRRTLSDQPPPGSGKDRWKRWCAPAHRLER